jgi:Novel toxin 17
MSAGESENLTPEQEALQKLNLPYQGEFPFLPPKRWRPKQPLHGPSTGGYYDLRGRLWKKGRSVTKGQHFEWDVQVPGGSHVNVDWTGRVTHPRSKVGKPNTKQRKGRRRK